MRELKKFKELQKKSIITILITSSEHKRTRHIRGIEEPVNEYFLHSRKVTVIVMYIIRYFEYYALS